MDKIRRRRPELPDPRMQPTGRKGAELRPGGELLEPAMERKFVRVRA